MALETIDLVRLMVFNIEFFFLDETCFNIDLKLRPAHGAWIVVSSLLIFLRNYPDLEAFSMEIIVAIATVYNSDSIFNLIITNWADSIFLKFGPLLLLGCIFYCYLFLFNSVCGVICDCLCFWFDLIQLLISIAILIQYWIILVNLIDP